MNKIAIDLEMIRQLAQEREEDNWTFRAYVKGWLNWSDEKFDDLVHRIVREVSAIIDCTECANCCQGTSLAITATELPRLAAVLELTVETFTQQYTALDGNERVLTICPCPLLKDNRCIGYAQRPRVCREFPHLLKKNVRSRMIGMVNNAEICPIVFHTLERLKKEIPGWRSRRMTY